MAASFVDNGKIVCDVGCDHGKLSLYLIKENKAEKIIATDINEKPLQKAIELFNVNNLSDRADFYLTNGLQDIKSADNITHIVIAGLGGNTMAEIIDAAKFIKENKTKLILLPAQNTSKIRDYLYKNGYSINKESTVCENKKVYSCISAVYTGEIKNPSIYDNFIGEIKFNNTQSDIEYFKMVKSQLEKQIKGQIITQGEADVDLVKALKQIEELALI